MHTVQSIGILVLLFFSKKKNIDLNLVKKEIPASTPTMYRKKPSTTVIMLTNAKVINHVSDKC
jgi:hypothetical protein